MDQFELEKLNIDLGKEFEDAKNSYISLKQSIQKLKLNMNDPANLIYEHFSKIRKKVVLDRKKIKWKVDDHFKNLIDELNEFEAACNKKNNLPDWHENDYGEVIGKAENELDRFKTNLNALKIDTKIWNNIQIEADHNTAIIRSKMADLRDDLFLNSHVQYKSQKFDENRLFRGVKITRTAVKRQRTLEKFKSFHFTKNDFKEFSGVIGSVFNSKKHIFNGMIWYCSLENHSGRYLECYLHCELGTIRYKEVTTHFKIQINNLKNSNNVFINNKIGELGHKFERPSIGGFGFAHFASFDDIFANDLYDRDTDSVHFSVFINILECL